MPKTFKHLYSQIYDFDNLYLAWRRAQRGGKRKWPSVAAFEIELEQQLWDLHDELASQTYAPGPYRHASGLLAEAGRLLGTWLKRYNRS